MMKRDGVPASAGHIDGKGGLAPSLVRGAILAVLFVGSLLIFFRIPLASGFSLLWGDRLDGGIEAAILEHWHNVLLGRSSWLQTFYFFPEKQTLGYNDGYFLYGIVSALFRMAGADIFLASELVDIVTKVIGFWGMFLLLRRTLDLSLLWAGLGAALYTIGHATFFYSFHEQLLSIAYAPWEMLLIARALDALVARNGRTFVAYGAAAGVLFGAWLLTAFYMAWFLVLFTITMLLCSVFFGGIAYGRKMLIAAWALRLPSCVVGLVAVVAMTPFLMIYLPKVMETGAHSFSESLIFLLKPNDIINSGPDNFLTGFLYPFYCIDCGPERTGITSVQFIVFVAAAAWTLVLYRGAHALVARSAALAVLVSWCLIVRFGDVSGWWLVFHLVPGAAGIRVVSRYEIFLTFPIVALSVIWLQHMIGRRPGLAFPFVTAILVLDQIGPSSGMHDRAVELARTDVPRPPPACRAFFTTQAEGQDASSRIQTLYPHNVEAMLIAELQHVPTINGFSTFMPRDWNFEDPTRPDYLDRVKAYAAGRNVTGLCRLDLIGKTWSGPID